MYCKKRVMQLIDLSRALKGKNRMSQKLDRFISSSIGPFLSRIRTAACHPLMALVQFRNVLKLSSEIHDLESVSRFINMSLHTIQNRVLGECNLCLDGDYAFKFDPCGHVVCHRCMEKLGKIDDCNMCLMCEKSILNILFENKKISKSIVSDYIKVTPVNIVAVKNVLSISPYIITSKMQWILTKINESEEKWLVFSQFTRCLDIMASFLSHNNVSFMQLDGRTVMQRRNELISEFQGKHGPKVALLSLLAAGVGITLTNANNVIFYEPYWSDCLEDQGSDRCHRISQTKEVTVYNLCQEGTVETNVFDMKSKKTEVCNATTGKNNYTKDTCKFANKVRLFFGSSILKQ